MAKKKSRNTKRCDRRGVYLPSDLQVSVAEASGRGEMTEDEAMDVALQMHPDLEELVEEDRLPEEFTDDQGNVWSPLLHLQMHAIIESQIGIDDPAGIVSLALELEQMKELHTHEIRHVLAAAMAEQLWCMDSEGQEFDPGRYLDGIRKHYDEFVSALM